jgi:hypothetical protein
LSKIAENCDHNIGPRTGARTQDLLVWLPLIHRTLCRLAADVFVETYFFKQKKETIAIDCQTLVSHAGLPDGLFSNQKYQFGSILEGLRLENVDIFYGHLEYFMINGDFL